MSHLTEKKVLRNVTTSAIKLDKSKYEIYKYYDKNVASVEEISSYINISLLVIGIINNLLCIYAFLQKRLLKRKFNWYLLILTIFRLIFCVILLVDYIFSKINTILLHDYNYISKIAVDFTIHTSDSCITMLTLFLSLDRLYAIKYAIKNTLKIRLFITNLHPKKLIGLSLVILIALKTFSFTFCEIKFSSDIHVIYCSLLSPLLFNSFPSVVILILNSVLVAKIIKYNEKHKEREFDNETPVLLLRIRRFDYVSSAFSRTQKSHYIIIIVSSVWSVITSIPYYSFNSYISLFQLKLFQNIFKMKRVIITQIISSIIFNSNHCLDFYIYLYFYNDFRIVLKNLFYRFFHRKIKTIKFY